MIRIPGGPDDHILSYKIQRQMDTNLKKVKVHPVPNTANVKDNRSKNLDYYQRNGVYLEFSEVFKEAQEKCR